MPFVISHDDFEGRIQTMLKGNKTGVWNVLGAVLMVILLVMQFTPFWQYGETGESCSISSYVWFPNNNGDVESWLESQIEDFEINDLILTPILVLLLGGLGAAFCLLKRNSRMAALLPMACGIVGTVGYLGNAALRLGNGWAFHLLLCIAIAAAGVLCLIGAKKE